MLLGSIQHCKPVSRQCRDNVGAVADKSIAGEKVENVAIYAHCTSIEKQLAAIRKEKDAMLKKLGIDIPDEHADHKEQGLDAKKWILEFK